MSGEIKKEDIDEMLQRTRKEIALRERSINRLEKQLTNAKDRLAILKGRESQYAAKALMRDYDVQSIDDLRKLLDDAHIKKADVNLATNEEQDSPTKTPPSGKAGSKEASAANGKPEAKKAEEPATDFSQMW